MSGSLITSNDVLAWVLFPAFNGVSPQPVKFAYGYNGLGDAVRMTDANGTVHDYGFDVLGRPTADVATTLGLNAVNALPA